MGSAALDDVPYRPRLPVIIVSFNTRDLLRQCLRALADSQGVELKVVVVDNASSDESAEMVRQEFPAVQLLAQPTNRGFAAANNVGLRWLGFGERDGPQSHTPSSESSMFQCGTPQDYVLLLNPDTEVRPDAIRLLVDELDSLPQAGAVGPQLIYADGRFQHSVFHFPGIVQTALDLFPMRARVMDSTLNGRYPRHCMPFQIEHPLGACILARATTVRQVGLLDEGYFMYVEEIDWCRRIHQAGWQIWCEPRATVVHHEAQSTRQVRSEMTVQLWRSRLRYFRKYYPPLYVACICALMRLSFGREMRRVAQASALPVSERESRMRVIADVLALCSS